MTISAHRKAARNTGLVGELLAMYQLERHGVQVAHVDRDEHDLWVRTPSGRMMTVQVKTATEPRGYKRARTPRYWLNVTNLAASTDLYAVVALQPEVVVFFYPKDMRKYFDPSELTRDRMEASIKELLA